MLRYRRGVDERALMRKAELAELLLHVARQLGETLEPDRVYDRFHELLADVIQHEGVVVSSFDPEDEQIRCEYAWVDGNRLDPSIFPPLSLNREGGGMQSRVIVTGEPLLANDVAERVKAEGTYYDVNREGEIRKLPDSGPPGTQAAMMVPVKHEGRVVGVVQLMSDHVTYDRDQLAVVEGLVAQMAAAVRNARLQKEQRRLEAAEAAARAAAAEREQAAAVLDAVGDGIFLVDREGVIRFWNRAAELLTGVRAERARDRPVDEAFVDWSSIGERIPTAAVGGAPARPVTLPVVVGGRELWLSFVAVRATAGIVYAFRDVTSEHRLEEAKDEFIATISHELRTPMAAVYGASLTLLREDIELEPGRQRELVQMIATQSARLGQITEEVLLTNQLDRGAVSLQRHRVDIGKLARAAVETMSPTLEPPATLDVDVAAGDTTASGDPDRIQQVLVNLLDNALKYGGGGPVAVHVETTNGIVRVSVTDSGPGISLADQQRVFDKFFRADPKLSYAPGGTGLGLYISRELVERMGGRLAVSSEFGAGATFVVELPTA
jgi:two-component system, OmpR family, phosphate regulon sensor histidine kinase PhoR